VAAVLAQSSDEQLEASIISLKERIDAAETELALRVAEYDRRRIVDERHVLTTKQWLRSRCRMSPGEASTTVRVGRVLSELDALTDASLLGKVPMSSVRIVTGVACRHAAAFGVHGSVLVDAATYLSTRDLRRAADCWEQQVAPEYTEGELKHRYQRRGVSVNQTFDGMWSLSGDLDPESGHVVAMAVRALADPANLDPDDVRTPRQRRADAVTEVCRFWLDRNDTAVTCGGTKPHITVTVDYDHLVLRGSMHADAANTVDIDRRTIPEIDGTPVPVRDIRRLACDADIVRMVVRGGSEILDVGRATRTVPSAMRRALEHRDGGCTWDGCDALAGWCDAHHVVHWAVGGPTSLDNLRLLCRRHHRAVHDGRRDRWPGNERRTSRPPPDP
jgi:hypothetical protein